MAGRARRVVISGMNHRVSVFALLWRLAGVWLLSALAASAQPAGPAYSWSTIWGRASFGSEDGAKSAARFRDVHGLAFDAAGNLYVADTGNHTIRRISATGVVTTLAGSAGESGSADGTGAAARFSFPRGLAVDAGGNVLVADTGNHTLRRITPTGVVTTIAGAAGQAGNTDGPLATARLDTPQGITVDASGTIYVHAGLNGIRRIKDGQIDTLVASTAVNKLSASDTQSAKSGAIAVDADGSLYFQGWDYVEGVGRSVIMRRDSAGNVVTLTPTGDAVPPGVLWIARGPDGMYFLVLNSTEQIARYWVYRLTATGAAQFVGRTWSFGEGMAVDATGAVYLSGFTNAAMQSLDAIARVPARPGAQGIIDGYAELWAGEVNWLAGRSGDAVAARFANLTALAVDTTNNVWAVDLRGSNDEARTRNHPVLLKLPATGASSVAAENASPVRSTTESWSVGVNAAGTVFFGSANGSGQSWSLQTVTPAGVATTAATLPYPELFRSRFMTVDSAGNQICADNGRLRKRSVEGGWSTLAGVITGGPQTVEGAPEIRDGDGSAARFGEIQGLAADSAGNVFVLDGVGNRVVIRRVTPSGQVSTLSANLLIEENGQTLRPSGGLARDQDGNFLLLYGNSVRRLDAAGNLQMLGGSAAVFGQTDGAGAAARFFAPQAIAVGATGNIYVSDAFGTVIRQGSLLAAPVVTTQPQSQTVTAGTSVQFTVTATGSPAPSYQWNFNGAAIGGATGNSYTISSAAAANAGDYTVTLSNSQGTITSAVARLTVSAASVQQSASNATGGNSSGGGGGGANAPLFTLAFVALWVARRLGGRRAA